LKLGLREVLPILDVFNILYSPEENAMSQLNSELDKYVEIRITEFSRIDNARKNELEKIELYIQKQKTNDKSADLIFICTHNSRRSHMSQIWTQTAASYYGIKNVCTFSGGTEATAFNPRAVMAMQNAGYQIDKLDDSENPVYLVEYSPKESGIRVFSKKYSVESNPQTDFCAVMTCSQADAACPVVLGASQRVSIPYEDPKDFDGTLRESEMYAERCQQISREMLYLMSRIKQ
jgi:protein-tyrosine-phosphatase